MNKIIPKSRTATMKNRLSRIGNIYFDKIKILDYDYAKSDSNKAYYICECLKCGWRGSVRYDNIIAYNGKTSKCNCPRERECDTTSLIGKVYGNLRFESFVYRKGTATYWKCTCLLYNQTGIYCKGNILSGKSTKCKQCALKILTANVHTTKISIGQIIHNNDDPDKFVTITEFDHYDKFAGSRYFWKWKCNFCGHEGVSSEYALKHHKYICIKCESVLNVKRIQPKFSRLTPIKVVDHNGLKWLCKCDCGNISYVIGHNLINGTVQSCGCMISYSVKSSVNEENYPANLKGKVQMEYNAMYDRCFNTNSKSYENYSSRGITICDRWLGENGRKNFLEDMLPTYEPMMTLDRIDNNKGYSPENCRWVTHREQQNNRDTNHAIEYKGVEYQSVQLLLDTFIESGKLSLADRRSKSSCICSRLSNGWSLDEAINIPPESYQHPDTVHNTTISYKDEWKKAHLNVDLSKLDKPIKSAIVFTEDRTNDYFEDSAKTNRRSMFYHIIPDPDKQ